ncbi:cyclin-T1-2-like isoform X2 [Curcuma longa]|uniref:cyclin-T1-2-like isoform X2 n=1 Tax=Curcuma longa TaxID=136217 RepID=UPI003D9F8F14
MQRMIGRFFYLHDLLWALLQTVATACMFLASKVEETPCRLDKIVVMAYETMHKSDPSAAGRIREKATFQKQKDLILIGERVLLSTIRFDFNVLHPYKPLLEALKKLGITQREVRQTAWNLVNDWLWTTFYVQYKPHYIAAGSLFLAAKLHNIKLPSERGYVWWHEFDIIPRQLEGAIQEMCQFLQCNRKSSGTSVGQPVRAPIAINEKQLSSSPDSVLRTTCISSNSSSQGSDADLNSHKHTDSDCHIQASFSSSEKKQIYLECRKGPQCHKTGTDIPTAAAKHNGASVDKQSMRKREHIQSMFGEIDKDRIRATYKRKREREVPVVEPSWKKQL